VRLLIDMNLSPRWVKFLNDADIEATHWSMCGAANAPDAEIMAYARANDFVVLTNDLDFSAILAVTNGEKPSVVQIRSEDLNPNFIGQAVIDALKQMTPELEQGALLTIDVARTRLRLLPLQTKH
jgi:predicted nuclease of predicted toxin-antitoxin system